MKTVVPFYTPIWVSSAGVDTESAANICLELERMGGVVKSNAGGYQSKIMREEDFSHKFKEIYEVVNKNISAIGAQTGSSYVLSAAWCNVNRKNNYNQAHVHPNSAISGCIYLKVPTGAGRIVFHNPTPSLHYPVNDAVDGFFATYWHEPEAGTMLFFPSYLSHHVELNTSDEPRISIAFNFSDTKFL